MRYRISQIKLNPGDSLDIIPKKIARKTGKSPADISNVEIIKESIDARKKPDVKLVYTVDFDCEDELTGNNISEVAVNEYSLETAGILPEHIERAKAGKRPVVVGFGPSGMFAALMLAEAGLKPIVIERGKRADARARDVERFWKTGILEPESNVQFGEGGAGTFSDGKLTTGIKDIRIGKVFDEFIKAGAPAEIKYKNKPHIGTDKLQEIVVNIRNRILSLGGEVIFETKMDEVLLNKDGSLKAVRLTDVDTASLCFECFAASPFKPGALHETIETDTAVLAIGHSARDTFEMLYDKGINMEQKPFSIGVRIEHPQEMIDEVQYGDKNLAKTLGAADYKLNHRCENGRGVYTFCMCPGGQVINASSEEGAAVTNGMSNSARDGEYANSGLLVDVRCEDFADEHPLAGMEFQRKYERKARANATSGGLAVSDLASFKANEKDPVRKSLPEFASAAIIEAMPHLGKKLKGFDRDDARLSAVETRSSSPVRIRRNEEGFCNVKGLMPAGEGPGYAGGIMSAAVDGIKTAEKVIRYLSEK